MNHYDFATPGVGPMKTVGPPMESLELFKYNTFNTSLKSKSDVNLNPQPEGVMYNRAYSQMYNTHGYYAKQTDRGELNPTVETQINMKGQQSFQNRLQDTVRPTTKESTIYTYEGFVAPVTQSTTEYSNIIPQYRTLENGKEIRVSGTQNYGLRTATEHSYVPGVAITGVNNNVIQNPENVIKNLWKPSDQHVDGPGTFSGAVADGSRFQNYRRITDPTTSGLKLNYNLETNVSSIEKYSPLLGNTVHGIENRYTASYQIAPLLTNPLHNIWNPEDKGEIPAFYTNSNPGDFSYIQQKHLPHNEYIQGGYNDVWSPNSYKQSSNSYVLGMQQGVYNDRIEWRQGLNNKPGVIYTDTKSAPGASYSGNVSIHDLYGEEMDRALPHVNNTFTPLFSDGYISVK
jgi:hypothetical protein